jgi:hypothetical protein
MTTTIMAVVEKAILLRIRVFPVATAEHRSITEGERYVPTAHRYGRPLASLVVRAPRVVMRRSAAMAQSIVAGRTGTMEVA